MATPKKQMVWDQTEVDLDGMTIERAQEHLAMLLTEYGPEASFDKNFPGYDGGYELILKYQREETDAEYKKRLKKEEADKKAKQKQAEKKREKELKELERLQKKYGKE